MKHETVRWNPGTKDWFCARCGHTSRVAGQHEAQLELEKRTCMVPSVETSGSAPGTETIRLIRKPYKMTLKSERSGTRFAVVSSEGGSPQIRLEFFHDTVSPLKSFSIAFETLSGTRVEQVKALVDAMNERIVGVVVTAKDRGLK
jgi:hypothetical protein